MPSVVAPAVPLKFRKLQPPDPATVSRIKEKNGQAFHTQDFGRSLLNWGVAAAEFDGALVIEFSNAHPCACGRQSPSVFVSADGIPLNSPTACPQCAFAKVVSADRDASGQPGHTPESLDLARAEREKLQKEFPAVAASLPPLSPIRFEGPIGERFGSVSLSLYSPQVHPRRLMEYVKQFGRGDLGVHGTLPERASDRALFAPPLAEPAERAAASLNQGGLLHGRYELTDRDAEQVMLARGTRDREHLNLFVDVIGLADGADGAVDVFAKLTNGDARPFD